MSSGIIREYAPDDIVQVVGTQPVTGVHEGTFVEIERAVDTTALDVGSDGEVTMTISPNQSGTIKMTLQQASPMNDYFNTLFQAIQQKNTAVGVVPYTLKDKNGNTVVSAKQIFVQKVAKVSFGDKPEGREWTFLAGYLDIEPGSEASI